MSLDFGLQRFDERGDATPKHPAVLTDILAAIHEAFPHGDDRYDVRHKGSRVLEVQLSAGVGEVRAASAAFNVHDLEDDDLQVVYAIARAGDMTVVTESGTVILTDPKQRHSVPKDLLSGQGKALVARHSKDLGRLLRGAYAPARAYRDKVASVYESKQVDVGPPPTGGAGTTAVYVQPRAGEKEMQQLRRLFKAADKFVAGRGGRQIKGTIGGLSWSLRLPTEELFIGCVVTGDVPDWMEFFRAYAQDENRCFGTIESDGMRFIVNDGRTFLLNKCELRRLTDDD